MLLPQHVFCARAPSASYDERLSTPAPELPGGAATSPALAAVRALFREAGLDLPRFGHAAWNPLGELIRPGARVLLKPNWVSHENLSGAGLDCLVTHPSLIEAVLLYTLKASPAEVVIGDAPIQGCDFDALAQASRLDQLLARCRDVAAFRDTQVRIEDFRRTVLPGGRLAHRAQAVRRSAADYVLFDLAHDSDLSAITGEATPFRVTMYDPRRLAQTHAPGRHQYLVAREAIAADVVINLPKLKMHGKACITGALKNLVGINGHKEYLPHHRKGGSRSGGDCYEGESRLKALAEDAYDVANGSASKWVRSVLPRLAHAALRAATLTERGADLEGSWHGNDTVWRMCLDLQRILRYGTLDGGLGETPQRHVLTITDAIVAGQGEGPLAPAAAPVGLLTMGSSTAATEWANACLIGLDPRRIPLTRHAFEPHVYPLVDFPSGEVVVRAEGISLTPLQSAGRFGHRLRPPRGWIGHCELEETMAFA